MNHHQMTISKPVRLSVFSGTQNTEVEAFLSHALVKANIFLAVRFIVARMVMVTNKKVLRGTKNAFCYAIAEKNSFSNYEQTWVPETVKWHKYLKNTKDSL